MKTLYILPEDFQQFVNGSEVNCTISNEKSIQPGEEVLVYKDSVAAITDAATPTREKQDDYLGLEGIVTSVQQAPPETTKTKDEAVRVTLVKK